VALGWFYDEYVHTDSPPETTAVSLSPSFVGRDYDDVVSRCWRCVGGW
jgi:hypothetical protein